MYAYYFLSPKTTTTTTKRHRKEVEPLLFGKGKMDLTDPDETDNKANDDASDADKSKASKTTKPTKGYGSTDSSAPTSPSFWTIKTKATSPKEDSHDDDDDNDDSNNDKDNRDDWENGGGDGDEEEGVMDEDTFNERTGRPSKPTRHWIVRIFFTVETYAIATNLTLLVSQALPLVSVPWAESDPGYLALKIYLCVFALLFLFVEIDHSSIPFLRKASFLKTFVSRGFLYSFFALVCFDEADSEKAYKALEEKNKQEASIFRVSWYALINQIAAASLLALGLLYVLMGILCLQRVRNRYVYDDRQKWKAYREALDTWKEGL
jgi:hypothetical protein